MKKVLLALLLLFYIACDIYGQGITVVTTKQDYTKKFLVGSMRKSGGTASSKLKIEIFGGDWYSYTLGTSTYIISVRDGLRINKVTLGGSTNKHGLKIYDNGDGYDFVIEMTEQFGNISIQSWLLPEGFTDYATNTYTYIAEMVPVKITEYDSAGKTDVTNSYSINNIISTNEAGNIGIGTASPKNKLDVKGVARAQEVKVEITDWADFVLAEDYDLPSLQYVEQHIKDKGTLPDIPSEGEVKKDGINLGEMQAKLLQKIEELTLYVIQQQKQLEEQAKLIKELQNK